MNATTSSHYSTPSAGFLIRLKRQGALCFVHLFVQLRQRVAGHSLSFLGPQQPVEILDHILATKLCSLPVRDQHAATLHHLRKTHNNTSITLRIHICVTPCYFFQTEQRCFSVIVSYNVGRRIPPVVYCRLRCLRPGLRDTLWG